MQQKPHVYNFRSPRASPIYHRLHSAVQPSQSTSPDRLLPFRRTHLDAKSAICGFLNPQYCDSFKAEFRRFLRPPRDNQPTRCHTRKLV